MWRAPGSTVARVVRARSEYRLVGLDLAPDSADGLVPRHPTDADREPLAETLLAAYRGTIDDEGETIEDALAFVDEVVLGRIDRGHSFLLDRPEGGISAFACVVILDGHAYIDPVVVAPDRKRQGVGRRLVAACLASLRDAGHDTVGATITDGNVASERLFASLGFERVGAWDPDVDTGRYDRPA